MIDGFFKLHRENCAAIHCHMANVLYFYFKIVKRFGIDNRVLHSRQSSVADSLQHNIWITHYYFQEINWPFIELPIHNLQEIS